MKLVEGLLNYEAIEAGHTYIFTANSMVKNGRLLMGGGAALAAYNAYPGVDALLGAEINEVCRNGVFGYVEVPHSLIQVGAFQTKTVVWEPSKLDLIEEATEDLLSLARSGVGTYHLNFPGIGLGGLNPEDVMPIIKRLPDNVVVYK